MLLFNGIPSIVNNIEPLEHPTGYPESNKNVALVAILLVSLYIPDCIVKVPVL